MRFLPLVLVLIVAALVFGQVVGHSLLMWDDDIFLYQNPLLQKPGMASVEAVWAAPYADLYAPVPYTVWIGLTRLFGGAAPGVDYWSQSAHVYHMTSLLTHLVAVGVAYWLLLMLVGSPWAAAAGAALFALHPLQVETVAWAAELKDLLGGAFGLLAIALVIKGRQSGRQWWLWLATAAFMLGLLSKPSVAALPLLALVIQVGLLRVPWREALRLVVPWLAISLVYVALTARFQITGAEFQIPLWQRLFIAGDALAFYLGKLAWPLRLGADYGRTPAAALSQWWVYVTWLAPAALLALAVGLRRKSRWALPALLWFVAALLPVLGLVPFDFQKYSTVADHYVYLAMLGPALALAGLCPHVRGSYPRLAVVVLLTLLTAQSTLQTVNWQSNIIFWQHTLAVNPRSFAGHVNLGTVYSAIKQYPLAEQEYQAALALQPGDPNLLLKLGLLKLDMNQKDQARTYLRQVVAVQPQELEAREVLGLLAMGAGEHAEAIEHLQVIVDLQPANARMRYYLAQALAAAGRKDGARKHLEDLIRQYPGEETFKQTLKQLK